MKEKTLKIKKAEIRKILVWNKHNGGPFTWSISKSKMGQNLFSKKRPMLI